jgi:hypothetical protein
MSKTQRKWESESDQRNSRSAKKHSQIKQKIQGHDRMKNKQWKNEVDE